MGRLQVFTLGLVLVLCWVGFASSTTMSTSKAPYPSSHSKKMAGSWYTIYMASNDLEVVLQWFGFMHLFNPQIECMERCWYLSFSFTFSSWGNCLRTPQILYKCFDGFYETMFLENILEFLDVTDAMLLLGFNDHSYGQRNYAVLALSQERTLSEADMEKVQKVHQDKDIMKQPVHFTSNDICIDDDMIGEEID